MALVDPQKMAAQAKGFGQLGPLRQLGLMVGLAASVAIGVAVVLWSREPTYSLLYGGLSEKDAAQVAESLDKIKVPYRLEHGAGSILVPAAKVHRARLHLATLGLPKGSGAGYELLEKEEGLGTSRLLQQARHHRALEVELARSISELDSVAAARVHLALPKQSVFIRDRKRPTASVLVNLYPGRSMEDERVAGVVHLVASSVPELEPEHVTVVDQRGRLLTRPNRDSLLAASGEHLDYARRLEEAYVQRIVDILSPIVGVDGVRAQVTAAVDFTVVESSSEVYDPERTALRSEQTVQEEDFGPEAGGVPGSLSNQPPEAGAIEDAALREETETTNLRRRSHKRSTRNLEVDRTISHTRTPPGQVERLSVAVVVDHALQEAVGGVSQRVPRGPEEMERITALVRQAVGFDAERGDTLDVINASFQPADEVEAESLPVPAFWEQAWVWDAAKQLLGVALVLLLLFGVLRPVLRSLATRGSRPSGSPAALPGAVGPELGQMALGDEQLTLTQQSMGALAAPGGNQYEQQLSVARQMAQDDPRRVAQVMKSWLATDGQ